MLLRALAAVGSLAASGHGVILAGWCTLWNSRALIICAALFMIGLHLSVVLAEEPRARRRFGAERDAYRPRVARRVI